MSGGPGRYEVAEFPNGWRVVERNANGEKVHMRNYRTEAHARARATQLSASLIEREACANVRKRSKNRCECLGECGRGHHARCPHIHGETGRIPGGPVVLSVVALDHNPEHLTQDNLRGYCQLCRCVHDAEEAGSDPLFTIGEVQA